MLLEHDNPNHTIPPLPPQLLFPSLGAFRLGYDENGETFVDAADPKIRSHVRLASLDLEITADRATALALVLDNQGCVWFDLTRQVVENKVVSLSYNRCKVKETNPFYYHMHTIPSPTGLSRGADPVSGEALPQGAASADRHPRADRPACCR